MKKLEDIEKRNIFKVPDGYFDQLPAVIQARVAKPAAKTRIPVFRLTLQYAVPALLVIAAFFWFIPMPDQDVSSLDSEQILASVDTESLIAYLDLSEELELDDVLDYYQPDADDLQEIEQSLYGDAVIDEEVLDLLESELDPNY